MYTVPVLILCALYFGFLIYVSARSAKQANQSFTNFAIGGGALPIIYIIFTAIAAQFGSGNFIGHGDSGYTTGLAWLPFILGEQIALVPFALLWARFSHLNYNSLAEFGGNRITRDKLTRAILGILIALPCLAWVGGQAMGLGFLFERLTGLNQTVIIIIAGIVFIVYGSLGGIIGMAKVDLVQGILIIILGIFFYYKSFGLVDYSLAELGNRVTALNPDLWSFKSVSAVSLLSSFMVGCLGTLSFQPTWQRMFAAKSQRDLKISYYIGAFCGCTFVPCSALVGMIAFTEKQDIAGGATMWLAANLLPAYATILIFVLLLAATMSTGVALLNSAAIAITNDCIRPYVNWKDEKLIKTTRIVTVIAGIFCILCALKFDYILDLAGLGYTACGGAVVPYILVGWLWRSKDERKKMSIKGSRISPWNARISLVAGSAVSIIFDTVPSLSAIMGGGVLPGAIITVILLFVLAPIFPADYSKTEDVVVVANEVL